MTMELEECIKDGFDDSLREYIQSEEYQQRQDELDKLICSFQINMSSEKKIQFKKIIDAIVADDGIIALEAYTRGVIEGIALQNKYVK